MYRQWKESLNFGEETRVSTFSSLKALLVVSMETPILALPRPQSSKDQVSSVSGTTYKIHVGKDTSVLSVKANLIMVERHLSCCCTCQHQTQSCVSMALHCHGYSALRPQLLSLHDAILAQVQVWGACKMLRVDILYWILLCYVPLKRRWKGHMKPFGKKRKLFLSQEQLSILGQGGEHFWTALQGWQKKGETHSKELKAYSERRDF